MYSCVICKGPINQGEPVFVTESGYVHRFKTTCEWHKEMYEKQDREFLMGVGIRVEGTL